MIAFPLTWYFPSVLLPEEAELSSDLKSHSIISKSYHSGGQGHILILAS